MRVLQEHSYKELHFIIGIGRSGTTLLTKVLNRHPEIHCQPEANFLAFFLNRYKHVKNFTPQDVEFIFSQIKIYSLSHPWVGWEFDIESVKLKLVETVKHSGAMTYEDLCKMIYTHFEVPGYDKSESRLLIDKNPSYTIFVNQLSKHFPESKYIWLIRDYRANVLSRKQSAYLKSPAVAYNAIRWRYFNVLANRFYKKHKEKVLLVRYEDLVDDHDNSINRILSFLQVKTEDMPSYDGDQASVNINDTGISPSHKKYFQKKYADLSKPINSSRVNAWQTELTEEEIKKCDAICSNFASRFGYKTYHHLSMFEKFAYIFKNLYVITTSILYIKKDQLFYFLPAKYKMRQLMKRHFNLGFYKS